MVSRKKAKGKARKAAKAAKNDVTPAVDDIHGHNHNQQPHQQQQLESLEDQMYAARTAHTTPDLNGHELIFVQGDSNCAPRTVLFLCHSSKDNRETIKAFAAN